MILRALKNILSTDSLVREAHAAYAQLVGQSRQPQFYSEYGVEDTVDGRFDVILLHMFLVIHRLRGEQGDEAGHFIRALSETFFSDMDRSLREMGVGDTGVGVRIKKMAQAFYGRMQHYEQSVHNPEAFAESLKRNLYRGNDVSADTLARMAGYVQRNAAHLQTQSLDAISGGTMTFLS